MSVSRQHTQEKLADGWGQPISGEQQAELAARLTAWDAPGADHGERKGPFQGVLLTGAEVAWLAEQLERDEWGPRISSLHLEGAHFFGAHLEGADLTGAHLAGGA